MTHKEEKATKTLRRYKAVVKLLHKFMEDLPDGAARIEVDIEFIDGGRIKVEGKP